MPNIKEMIEKSVRYHMSAESHIDAVRQKAEDRIKNAYKSLGRSPSEAEAERKDKKPVRYDAVKHDAALSPEERIEKVRRDSEKRITNAYKNLDEYVLSFEDQTKPQRSIDEALSVEEAKQRSEDRIKNAWRRPITFNFNNNGRAAQ